MRRAATGKDVTRTLLLPMVTWPATPVAGRNDVLDRSRNGSEVLDSDLGTANLPLKSPVQAALERGGTSKNQLTALDAVRYG
jgi:hypothetical protein